MNLLDYVKEHFLYSEKDKGLLLKKATSMRNKFKIGQKPGNVHPLGYRAIKIRGHLYRESRLIFLLFNGSLPSKEIDHVNKDQLDNRISNLRECSRSQNCANRKRWGKSSKFRGVHWHKKTCKWQAAIRFNKKSKYLGLFEDQKQAALAYNQEAIKCFAEFANLNEIE